MEKLFTGTLSKYLKALTDENIDSAVIQKRLTAELLINKNKNSAEVDIAPATGKVNRP